MFEQEMLKKMLKDENFEKYYLEVLTGRFTTGSIQLETDSDIADFKNAIMYSNNLTALKYLLHKDSKLNLEDIKKVAKIVEEDDNDKGFRTGTIFVEGSNIERALPRDIYMKMYSLLDNYYNVWDYSGSIFFKEAMFHLQFLLIHPFSDGNGRTARIITATNLLKQGLLPGIITNANKKEYCEIIERQNPNELADFFEKLSFKEDIVFAKMYENYLKIEKDNSMKL